MKRSSSELKGMARGALLGHYALPIGAFVLLIGLSLLVNAILSAVFAQGTPLAAILNVICSFIISLLTVLFDVGYSKLLLNLSRGQETKLSDLLYCFSNHPDRMILLAFCVMLIGTGCYLPFILFLVLGTLINNIFLIVISILLALVGTVIYMILMLSYSQITFLYVDHPEMGVFDLMHASREIMHGNRLHYFYVVISFIGLSLLSMLPCFVGYLWLMPYMNMTLVLFYRERIGEI